MYALVLRTLIYNESGYLDDNYLISRRDKVLVNNLNCNRLMKYYYRVGE